MSETSAFNTPAGEDARPSVSRKVRAALTTVQIDWRVGFAFALLAAALLVYFSLHPRGLAVMTVTPWANRVAALAFTAVGQFCVILTGGLDLSLGAILSLSNVMASHMLSGSGLQIVVGMMAILAMGLLCGLVNAALIVYGRIEPIIATLATGAIYGGIALVLRPTPGGLVDESLSDIFTLQAFGTVPNALITVFLVVFLVMFPLSRSVIGRTIRAVGSNSAGAYISGLQTSRAIFIAYALSGFFAACAGIFLAAQTLAGDAGIGADYTINSIAAVVLGGASMLGGRGSVLGVIAGAAVLRTIGAVTIFTSMPALAQPLFEGIVLMIAVAVGGLQIVRISNKLEKIR